MKQSLLTAISEVHRTPQQRTRGKEAVTTEEAGKTSFRELQASSNEHQQLCDTQTQRFSSEPDWSRFSFGLY